MKKTCPLCRKRVDHLWPYAGNRICVDCKSSISSCDSHPSSGWRGTSYNTPMTGAPKWKVQKGKTLKR